jgi:hypothetical protein
MVNSTASDVVVVMVFLFGYVGDEEWAAGDPGVDGASAMSAPRSCPGSLARWQWTVWNTGCGVKVFPDESSTLRRQRWQCMRVS